MKGTTEQQDAVICSQCDGERRTNSQMRGVSGSLQAEGFGEMADWLEPRQHICVALATADWTPADHWIQMLENFGLPIPRRFYSKCFIFL